MLDPDPEAEQPYRRTRWRGPCFRDRTDAGTKLSTVLAREGGRADVVVALSPSGVPVARSVADELGVPLELVVTRRIDPPGDASTTIGAVTDDGSVWIDEARVPRFSNADEYLERAIARERRTARQEAERVRGDRGPMDPEGRSVLIVTEGIDYPAPVAAVVRQVRAAGAAEVTVGAPVVAPDCREAIRALADDLYSVVDPAFFATVAQFYESFDAAPEAVVDRERREPVLPH